MSSQQQKVETIVATERPLSVSQQQMAEVIGRLLAHEWSRQQHRDRTNCDRSGGLADSGDLVDAKSEPDGCCG